MWFDILICAMHRRCGFHPLGLGGVVMRGRLPMWFYWDGQRRRLTWWVLAAIVAAEGLFVLLVR
jgi:hypothetical protein